MAAGIAVATLEVGPGSKVVQVLVSLCLDPRRPWSDFVTLARTADQAGLHTAFVPDHFIPFGPVGATPPGAVLEGWTSLAGLAVATSRIRLGTLVLGNTYRHPAVVANMAATLDQMSGGRVTLGLGAAWQQNEHHAYGIELPDVGERLDRFEEAVAVIHGLLRSDLTTFDGAHYRLVDARCEPKPLQQPLPLLVAGAGERRTIPIAARYADAWHAWTTPETMRHKGGVLDAACAALGRDATQVKRLTGQVLRVTNVVADDESDVIGPVGHVADVLRRYDEAGTDEFIVRDHADVPIDEAIASLESVGSQVVPALA